MKFALLVFMLLAHIVDDYYLQGWLASAKQKKWWEKNAPDELYKFDYIMALFCHALSWAIMICLPIIIYSLVAVIDLQWFYLAIPVNLVIHAIVDDLKANKLKINLIADQSAHFLQIILTWYAFTSIFNV
jgi:hypothetical protein